MPLIVQKYGGTSVGNIERLQNIAQRIKKSYESGLEIVVVLSAMGKSTDELVTLASQIHPKAQGREMDMLLATGEQVSISLMAMALHNLNIPAIALTGSQAGVNTFGLHTQARIAKIDTQRILAACHAKQVCLVAGFQGKDSDNDEIYTLGRGGSDTSAVALAVALKAQSCEIFTDVDGIYTADPRNVPQAQRMKYISYEEMLELARLGAGILHSRSVELASKNKVYLHVRSSFKEEEGSFVMPENEIENLVKQSPKKEADVLEKVLIRGVSLKSDEARIAVLNIPDRPGLAAKLFCSLAEENISVDMIIQSIGQSQQNTIAFTVLQRDLKKAEHIARKFIYEEAQESSSEQVEESRIEITPQVAIVSAVGVGMKSHSGIAAAMFQALAKVGVNIEMISTSEIKISVVIQSPEQGELALQAIHTAFGLDK